MRLIDADALKNVVKWLNDCSTLGILAAIDKLPTVDAVEVVRCEDCKYLYTEYADFPCSGEYDGMCGSGYPKHFSDFCSDGKRRSE